MALKGKNVIYIGGFGGIGQKCTEELLKNEIKNLIIFDLNKNQEYLEYLQNTYASAKVDYISIDMAKRETIEKAFELAKDKLGHFDIVVNGSGIADERLIDMTIAINFTGVIHSTLIALNYMDILKGGQGGTIVNISSCVGLEPNPVLAIYSATKCAVTAFTRSISSPVYFEKTGVSFITICPGGTITPILDIPSAKMTKPEYSEAFKDFIATLKTQSPEELSKNFIKILEKPKNGSVWLLDLGEMKEIEFPVMWIPPTTE